MKKSDGIMVVVLCVLVLRGVGLIPVLQVDCWDEERISVSGNVLTVPEETSYDEITYYQFNFSVVSSNVTWIEVYPLEMTILARVSMMVDVVTQVGQNLTIVCYRSLDPASEIPVGFYIAVSIGPEQGASQDDWIQTLKDLWNLVSEIGKIIVTLLVQIFEAVFHISVPSWIVGLLVVGCTLSMFLKFFKKLPLILLIIGFFVCAAITGSVIQTLML